MNQEQKKRFQKNLLKWSSSNRRDFVWRSSRATPFQILISEMLLRKTRAQNVELVVRKIFTKYPSIKKLSQASMSDLEIILSSLGLQRIRAKAIIDVAILIRELYRSRVPNEYDKLIQLPHVGRYASNAMLCFAFGQRRPIVDANIVRLFNRLFNIGKPVEVHKADDLWDLAESLLPQTRFQEFNWALLDLAATICKPRTPNCKKCPIKWICDNCEEKNTSREI